MEQGQGKAFLTKVGVDSIALVGGKTRRVLLALASRRLREGEDCIFTGEDPGGVWHVHIVFPGDATSRPWVDYARSFVVILPRELAVAKCEEDGAIAVLYNVQS